jgi:hypothetical protein
MQDSSLEAGHRILGPTVSKLHNGEVQGIHNELDTGFLPVGWLRRPRTNMLYTRKASRSVFLGWGEIDSTWYITHY